LFRDIGGANKPISVESGDPVGVIHVCFAAWDVFEMSRVAEGYNETQGFPDMVDRLPVNACGFHSHMFNTQVKKFKPCFNEVIGKGRGFELMNSRLPVLGFDKGCDGEFLLVDVNTCGIGQHGLHKWPPPFVFLKRKFKERVNKNEANQAAWRLKRICCTP
jgi:hypothetical protein